MSQKGGSMIVGLFQAKLKGSQVTTDDLPHNIHYAAKTVPPILAQPNLAT